MKDYRFLSASLKASALSPNEEQDENQTNKVNPCDTSSTQLKHTPAQ
jgi:hypothetical protein